MSNPSLPRQIESLAWTCFRRFVSKNGGGVGAYYDEMVEWEVPEFGAVEAFSHC
jgi:hypothetical protein